MKKIRIGKPKHKEKLHLFGDGDQTVLPTGEAKLEITGNREAVVDGCRNVIDYYDDRIKLNLGGRCVCFCGQNLFIESFQHGSAVLKGKIERIEYC